MNSLLEVVLICIVYSAIMFGLIFYLDNSFKYRFIFGYISCVIFVLCFVFILKCPFKYAALFSMLISTAGMARIPSLKEK